MIKTTPKVDAAFHDLLSRLAEEADEMKKAGGEIFHGGAPREAQGLLARAKAQMKFRDRLAALHNEWKKGLQFTLPARSVPATAREVRAEQAQPGLIKNIKGMSLSEAAAKLGTSPAKMKSWLEDGRLKGYQRVSGTWKITQADLVTFMRNHRELL